MVSTDGGKPLKNVSLDIRAGEIVAIAGVEGNGQRDLEYVVSGMIKPTQGEVSFKRTKLVTDKYKSLKRSVLTRNISLLIGSGILFIIGALLLWAALSNTWADLKVDIRYILGIIAGFAILFGFILVGVVLNSVFGAKLKSIKLRANSALSKQLTKNEIKFFKYATTFSFLLLLIALFLSLGVFALSSSLIGVAGVFGIVFFILFVITVIFATTRSKLFPSIEGKREDNALKNQRTWQAGLTTTLSLIFVFAAFVFSLLTGADLSTISGFVTALVVFVLLTLGLVFFVISVTLFISVSAEKELFNPEKDKFITLNDLSVAEISKLGLSFIPSDRHKHGLVLDYNIKQNTTLRRLWDSKYNFLGIFKNKPIMDETKDIIEKYDVRGARGGYSTSRSLSGGNQQKFIVGREMNSPHDFILILQPTRGLDVGAIKNIHERILAEKKAGKAILLISYELDEVLALADKIAVLNTGEILTVQPAKDLTRTEIGIYMARKDNEKGEN
ncbi:ATP-binding cassette domain-containing protein [Mycoplasma nasistruthionis]|uniref:ATP-binding cassette domain-containing protein n=1 Tax=Mycoplasma nasistruthionis TaxID=353852 RepID=UPI0030B81E5E